MMMTAAIETGALLDNMPDAVVIVDEAGRIVYANGAVRTLLGHEPHALAGERVEVLVPQSARAAHAQYLEQYGRAPRPMQMSARPLLYAIDAAGNEVPVSISIGAVPHGERKYFMAILRDASAVQQRIGEVLALAERDSLTGLGNRLHLIKNLESAVRRGGFSLLYLDLAGFKPFNDQFGHAVGDEVLKIVARRIQSTTRSADVSARIGGDEFAILLPDLANPVQLRARALTIAKAIREPICIEASRGKVHAHVGGAIFPEDGRTSEEILVCADRAMYRAKRSGQTYFRFNDLSADAELSGVG